MGSELAFRIVVMVAGMLPVVLTGLVLFMY
jgi:hypothetical protein